jgi:hypothetical protein
VSSPQRPCRGAAEPASQTVRLPKRSWTSPGFEKSGPLYSRRSIFADTTAPDRLVELNDKLAKLERYERRAFSRSNRAQSVRLEMVPTNRAIQAKQKDLSLVDGRLIDAKDFYRRRYML